MFVTLLFCAVGIAIFLMYVFLKSDNSDLRRIVTKLESLDKKIYEGREENVFQCVLSHAHDSLDQITVFPLSENEPGSKPLGSVPYRHKSRILRFMNTSNLGCKAEFNISTEELTIDLIGE